MSELQHIRSETDLERALARIEEIFFAGEGAPEEKELEDLLAKIGAYESARFPREMPEPIETIKFMMEQGGYEPQDLASCFDNAADVMKVLTGEQSIGLTSAVRLHERLGIPLKLLWPNDITTAGAKDSPAKLQRQ